MALSLESGINNPMNDAILEYLTICFTTVTNQLELPLETSLEWETSLQLFQNVFSNIGGLLLSILRLVIYISRPVFIFLYKYLGFFFRWMKPYASLAFHHTVEHLKKQDALTLLVYLSILLIAVALLYIRSLLKRLKIQKYIDASIKSCQKYMDDNVYQPLKKVNTVAAEVLPRILLILFFICVYYIWSYVLCFPSPIPLFVASLSNSSIKEIMFNLILIYYPAAVLYYKIKNFRSFDTAETDHSFIETDKKLELNDQKEGNSNQNNVDSRKEKKGEKKNQQRNTLRSSLSPRLSLISRKATSLLFDKNINNSKNDKTEIENINKALISLVSYWIFVALSIVIRNLLSRFWLDKVLAFIPLNSNYVLVCIFLIWCLSPSFGGYLLNRFLIPYASTLFAPLMTVFNTLEKTLTQPSLWLVSKFDFIDENMYEKIKGDFQGCVITFPCYLFILAPGFITKWGIDIVTLLYPTYAILKIIYTENPDASKITEEDSKKKDKPMGWMYKFFGNASGDSKKEKHDAKLKIENEKNFRFYYNRGEQLLNWCKYWILYAILHFVFHVVDPIIGWVFFYHHLKLLLFLYLLCPILSGQKIYVQQRINVYLWMMPLNLEYASRDLVETIEANRVPNREEPETLIQAVRNEKATIEGKEEFLGWNSKGEKLYGIPTPLKKPSTRRYSLPFADIESTESNANLQGQIQPTGVSDISCVESKEIYEESSDENNERKWENAEKTDGKDDEEDLEDILDRLKDGNSESNKNLRNRRSSSRRRLSLN